MPGVPPTVSRGAATEGHGVPQRPVLPVLLTGTGCHSARSYGHSVPRRPFSARPKGSRVPRCPLLDRRPEKIVVIRGSAEIRVDRDPPDIPLNPYLPRSFRNFIPVLSRSQNPP